MHSFTDRNGDAWDLDLNIGSAMRLQSRLQIRIEDAITLLPADHAEKSLLERISEDSILLFNIIFVLCEDQVQKREMTQEQFAERFTGDAIEQATEALMEELINFSRPARRKILLQLRQLSQEISDRAGEEVTRQLADPKFREVLESNLTRSLTNSPEFSE